MSKRICVVFTLKGVCYFHQSTLHCSPSSSGFCARTPTLTTAKWPYSVPGCCTVCRTQSCADREKGGSWVLGTSDSSCKKQPHLEVTHDVCCFLRPKHTDHIKYRGWEKLLKHCVGDLIVSGWLNYQAGGKEQVTSIGIAMADWWT
jgi:hypothetical protein